MISPPLIQQTKNHNRKSYECKIYTPITWHILRGIFDGDGGFHKDRTRLGFFVCGKSLVFMNQVRSFLQKNGFKTYLRERKNSSGISLYYVEIYKVADVLRLGELMYDKAQIFLKRKHERWLEFYENRKAAGKIL